MKPYVLIQGSNKNVEQFETKISEAIEAGYIFAGELITQCVASSNEVLFFQPLILDEDELEFEDEDDLEMESEDFN
ncbi:MAG: hypothetical protein JWM09_285 [Francisellaceae bacterium]|nr:hypothetical protein [Francisellaceae bacterium]